jgi:hypothetical protein
MFRSSRSFSRTAGCYQQHCDNDVSAQDDSLFYTTPTSVIGVFFHDVLAFRNAQIPPAEVDHNLLSMRFDAFDELLMH